MAKRSLKPATDLQQALLCRQCTAPLLTPDETRDGVCGGCGGGDDLFAARPAALPPPEIPEKPSLSIRRYWLEVESPAGFQPRETPQAGKWLIFVDVWNVDQLWHTICEATLAGRLGTRSKVATAKANQSASSSKPRAIAVYTYDAGDVVDVMRVRAALRDLGIGQKIPYKGEIGVIRYS